MFLKVALLILPILASGLIFVLILKLNIFKFLRKPLDFGLNIGGKRLFGDNKTFLGFVVMTLSTGIYGIFFGEIYPSIFSLVAINHIGFILNFFILGFSYSLGELPNSFIKRRLDIKPGELIKNKFLRPIFRFIDLTDSLVATSLVYHIIFRIEFIDVVISLIVGVVVHFFVDYTMYILKLKNEF